MNIRFRNYCIVILGETNGCQLEIQKIAEGRANLLPAKGITIATFKSAAEVGELTDYFKSFGRNFLLFDLAKDNSGFNILSDEIRERLFDAILEDSNMELEEMSNRLIDEIKSSTDMKSSGATRTQSTDSVQSVEDIAEEARLKRIKKAKAITSPKDKTQLMNKILDKGPENLTKLDREILEILSK